MKHSRHRPKKLVFTFEVAGVCPTRAEIDAGMVLHQAEAVGFIPSPTSVGVSDGSSRMPQTISGRIVMPRQQRVVYVGEAIAEGTEGYLLFAPEGDVEGYELEKWPVQVALIGRPERLSGGVVRRTVTFSTPEEPTLDCLVPPADGAGS